MPTTTTLKLPDDVRATVAKVAALQGKTPHALMVETLRTAMEDALAQQQFYADGETAYQDTLKTNAVFEGDAVKAYVLGKIAGKALPRPEAIALNKNISKPIGND